MRLSSLVVVLLLISPVAFAQHSSGGGSSSGASSNSGGSHSPSGSSSGSSYTSAHSSGGSASSSSHSSRGSSSHGSSSPQRAQSPNRVANPGNNSRPEPKGWIDRLHHPFRKHTPKAVYAGLGLTVCKNKSCPCPPGQTRGKNVRCFATNDLNQCQSGEYWNGGACASASLFRRDDCSSLALALRQEEAQMQHAEVLRQTGCARDSAAQECSELTAQAQDATTRHDSLLRQYQACRAVSCPYGDHCHSAYSLGLSFQ
jgi:hypothetical protein